MNTKLKIDICFKNHHMKPHTYRDVIDCQVEELGNYQYLKLVYFFNGCEVNESISLNDILSIRKCWIPVGESDEKGSKDEAY